MSLFETIKYNRNYTNKYCNCFYEPNKKLLYLDYYDFIERFNTEEEFNNFLDLLNQEYNLYNKCIELYINSDSEWKLPSNFLKFNSLLVLNIEGCRWFELDCKYIPKSVEILYVHEQSNLPRNFLQHSQQLSSLREIYLPYNTYFDEELLTNYNVNHHILKGYDYIPLHNLLSLQKIYICYTFYGEDDLLYNWKENIIKLYLLVNIKHRINNIKYIDDTNIQKKYEGSLIIIELN
jgi:hypothetical protein